MTPLELEAWNLARIGELKGDARAVAQVVAQMGVKIVEASRDYKRQALDMAQNACAQRDSTETPTEKRYTWIKQTYADSLACRALQQWFEQHPNASEPDIVSGFTHIMRGLAPHELRALSKHIVMRERDEGDGTTPITVDDYAEAFDCEVGSAKDAELCKILQDSAEALGGRFLKREGLFERRHWQAK